MNRAGKGYWSWSVWLSMIFAAFLARFPANLVAAGGGVFGNDLTSWLATLFYTVVAMISLVLGRVFRRPWPVTGVLTAIIFVYQVVDFAPRVPLMAEEGWDFSLVWTWFSVFLIRLSICPVALLFFNLFNALGELPAEQKP